MFGRLKKLLRGRQKRNVAEAYAPGKIDEFAELLARSHLTTSQQANEWLELFRAECLAADDAQNAITEFCSFLIAGDRITEWQCEKLKLGRWKGFYFDDHYVLLEQVGKGGDNASSYYSSYKARDIRTNKHVCLFIRPLRYTGGYIEYRVYPYM
jgi:hypothetical protein